MKELNQTENQPIALTVEETGISDTGTRLNWNRPLIDRQMLAQLNQKNDWRPLLQNLSQLLFSAATGAFAFWAFHNLAWPWVVGAVFLHCTFYGFFGTAGGHELSHKNMFKTKWLNELFIRINGFLTWLNYIHFRHSHAKHHQYTTHHVLDGEVILPHILRWFHWIYSLTIGFDVLKKVFPMLFRQAFGRRGDVVLKSEWDQRIFATSKTSEVRKLVNWSRFLLGGHALLALTFILSGHWILLILVTFAPFIANWFGLLIIMPQHIGMEPDVADWRHSTRTYLAGPIVRYFYWNMNYHVEHHMFAAVPFYNLPKLRQVLETDLPIAPKGLIATWLEIIDTLRKQKKDPSYYRPLQYPDN